MKSKTIFQEREGHDYWTLRGNEETSNLLAVRTAVADGMELLLWERKHEGYYKSRNKQKQMKAYTRILLAKIMLKHNVGYMGKEMRVALVHCHFQVANTKTRASADKTTAFGHG